jgi:hypothetical protein
MSKAARFRSEVATTERLPAILLAQGLSAARMLVLKYHFRLDLQRLLSKYNCAPDAAPGNVTGSEWKAKK